MIEFQLVHRPTDRLIQFEMSLTKVLADNTAAELAVWSHLLKRLIHQVTDDITILGLSEITLNPDSVNIEVIDHENRIDQPVWDNLLSVFVELARMISFDELLLTCSTVDVYGNIPTNRQTTDSSTIADDVEGDPNGQVDFSKCGQPFSS